MTERLNSKSMLSVLPCCCHHCCCCADVLLSLHLSPPALKLQVVWEDLGAWPLLIIC